MNEHEDYFRISKNGDIHTLSDRIPFKWNELIVWTTASFLFLIFFLGLGIGIFIGILTLIGYTLYRFTAAIYYSELKINEKKGTLIRLKKFLSKTQKTELITDKFELNRFEFSELTRSGKTKFLMKYRTHKDHDLLILRNEDDKNTIENYIRESITVYNNVYS